MLTRRDDVITDDKTTLAQRHRGAPPCEHQPHIQPWRRPGEFCRTGGQLAADYPRNCRRLLGRMAAVHQQTTHGTSDDCWGGWLPYTSRLPTKLQTTAGEDGCHTPAAGLGTPTWASRTEDHRRGRSIRWTSFLPTCLPLTGGEDRTTRATLTGETRTFATVAAPTAGPSRSSMHKTTNTPR